MTESLTPNLSLLQINVELQQLLTLRETAERDGALPDEMEAIDAQIREYHVREIHKADGIAYNHRVLEMAIEQAKAESKRCAERAKIFERRLKRLDDATIYALQAVGKTKVETPLNTIRYQEAGKQALETDSRLDSKWCDVTVTMPYLEWKNLGISGYDLKMEPSNERIRAALSRQALCPECKGAGETSCQRCEGKGTIPNTVPGARLKPRSLSLRVE